MTKQDFAVGRTASVEQRVDAIQAVLDERGMQATEAVEELSHLAMEQWVPRNGARVVARAWVDPAFRARLLANGRAAVTETGLALPKHHRHLVVLENTSAVQNVICCTLCSCTAFTIIGLPPEVEIRMWDTTADTRYMVLPETGSCADARLYPRQDRGGGERVAGLSVSRCASPRRGCAGRTHVRRALPQRGTVAEFSGRGPRSCRRVSELSRAGGIANTRRHFHIVVIVSAFAAAAAAAATDPGPPGRSRARSSHRVSPPVSYSDDSALRSGRRCRGGRAARYRRCISGAARKFLCKDLPLELTVGVRAHPCALIGKRRVEVRAPRRDTRANLS